MIFKIIRSEINCGSESLRTSSCLLARYSLTRSGPGWNTLRSILNYAMRYVPKVRGVNPRPEARIPRWLWPVLRIGRKTRSREEEFEVLSILSMHRSVYARSVLDTPSITGSFTGCRSDLNLRVRGISWRGFIVLSESRIWNGLSRGIHVSSYNSEFGRYWLFAVICIPEASFGGSSNIELLWT